MIQKIWLFTGILALFLLSACSVNKISVTQTAPTVAVKLAYGILKMEDSSLAVTPAQAATLLPLWKAVAAMGKDFNSTKAEINALYNQIQSSLTAEQIAYIKDLKVDAPRTGGTPPTNMPAPLSGQSSSPNNPSNGTSPNSAGGQTMGGDGTGGGMPGGDMSGGTPPDMAGGGSTSSSSSSTTAKPSGSPSSQMMVDDNIRLASQIVALLKKKIS
jgi:hypothetical protein